MAKKSSGESKAPLVIALAFFVLSTLVLGVLAYLAYSEINEKANFVVNAKKEVDAANKLRSVSDEKILIYKVAIGNASEEERTSLQTLRNKEEVQKEHTALMDAVKKQLDAALTAKAQELAGKGDGPKIKLDISPSDVFSWEWPEGGALTERPKNYLLDQVVTFHAANQVAAATYKKEIETAAASKKNASQAVETYTKAADSLKAEEVKYAPAINAQIAKLEKISKDTVDALANETKKLRDELKKVNGEKGELELVIRKQDEEVKKLSFRVNDMEAKLEVKDDPFAFDKPLGKILRRKGNVVEIDLGSSDNVKPGLTFSVQPSDTPERGLTSRMKTIAGPNGQSVTMVVPKGMIEVIEVLGPNSSQCRITSEANTIRDGVLVGDVLYNSAWRKGGADHVALFGIFDLDGDGIDDIRQLARELTKSGVVVDAYYDLETKKWIGNITERTIYVIEGIIPFKNIQAGESPGIVTAKNAVRGALDEARKVAKDRGSKVVKMRDFFPRVGLKAKLDVSEDKVDQAASRYLIGGPAEGEQPKN